MKSPDWEKIFPNQKITHKEYVKGGYANDVWHIETEKGSYVVKIPRSTSRQQKPFWYGLYTVFHLDQYWHIRFHAELADFINNHSPLVVPHMVRLDLSEKIIPRPYLINQYLPGSPVDLEHTQDPHTLAYELGQHLGSLHKNEFDFWGTFSKEPAYSPDEWKTRLPKAMQKMAQKWFRDRHEVHQQVNETIEQINDLPEPDRFTLILPDLRPSQFIERDSNLFALVDIESHVVGPQEMDWVAVEYSLPRQVAGDFKKGYEEYLPAPRLKDVRKTYRLLGYLINILGWTSFDEWMNAPTLFD